MSFALRKKLSKNAMSKTHIDRDDTSKLCKNLIKIFFYLKLVFGRFIHKFC